MPMSEIDLHREQLNDPILRQVAGLAEEHGWSWRPTDAVAIARVLEIKPWPEGQGVFFSVIDDRCRAEVPFVDQLPDIVSYVSPEAILSRLLGGEPPSDPVNELNDRWRSTKLDMLEIVAAINFNSISSARLGVDPEDGEVRALAQVKIGAEGLCRDDFDRLLADLQRVMNLFGEFKSQLALRAWTSQAVGSPRAH